MDIRKLQRVVVDALEDVKAADIAVYNSTGLTQLFDRVIIASGTSNRQTKALATSVRDKVKAAGGQVISIEGEDTGEWVLVDLGDAIVHVMQPAIRSYYNLEEIWGSKPVSLKSQAESDGFVDRLAVAKKVATTKVATKKVPAKKVVAKKVVAKKAAAKKAAARTAVSEVAARKSAARTSAPSAARKTARKTVGSH
jgi:ribosome-associated protein